MRMERSSGKLLRILRDLGSDPQDVSFSLCAGISLPEDADPMRRHNSTQRNRSPPRMENHATIQERAGSDRRKNALRRILRRHGHPELQTIRSNRQTTQYLRVFPVRFPNGRHEHTPALRFRAVGLIMAAAVTMVTHVGSASGSNECPDASNAPGDQSQVG
jgi:hypothetical protein